MYWGAGERKKSMCCNNFHIVIFSDCHLTTAVVFSPVIGVSTLNSCVVIVSILFLCQRCFLKGELCLIPNKWYQSFGSVGFILSMLCGCSLV